MVTLNTAQHTIHFSTGKAPPKAVKQRRAIASDLRLFFRSNFTTTEDEALAVTVNKFECTSTP